MGIYNVTRNHNTEYCGAFMACPPTNDYYIYCAELQLVTFLLIVKHLSIYIAIMKVLRYNIAEIVYN